MAHGKCEENTAFNLKEIYGYMISVLSCARFTNCVNYGDVQGGVGGEMYGVEVSLWD